MFHEFSLVFSQFVMSLQSGEGGDILCVTHLVEERRIMRKLMSRVSSLDIVHIAVR